ncbi:MAG: DUF3795 domain-containing protein [Patescibacteria group bacterium]
MKTPLLISPCGMNCSLCAWYLAMANNTKKKGVKISYCPGCRIKKKFCGHIMKKCSFYKNKKIDACYECKKMPCRVLKRLDNRYTKKYHMSMIENNKYIKKYGLKKFLAWQKKKWACPKCGELICCHNGLCFKCEINKLKLRKKTHLYEWDK